MVNYTKKLIGNLPVRYQNIAKQFVKFGVVGAIGAIVDFGTYNLISRGFGWDKVFTILGYQVIGANLISVFLAIVSNFILNKYWTFRDKSEKVAQQWTQYFILNFITFILNQIITSFFAFHVAIIAAIFGSQKDNIAKVLAIGIILFLNFAGSKLLVFRKAEEEQPAV